jgi:hypothetical protein
MTVDYLLVFPSKAIAEQFGIANGFAALDENGEVQSSLASHTHALCIIGEHEGDGQYWVLFRDLVGIPIPEGGEQFIFWASDFTVDDEEGNPVPVPRPISDDVPSIWWA